MPTRLRPEEVVTIAVLDEKGKFVAETRTKLAQMTEQRDQVRSELSLARAWIGQTSNKAAFEAWVVRARADAGEAPAPRLK